MIIRHCTICDDEFSIAKRYRNYLLPEFEHFCSTECLLYRIQNNVSKIIPVETALPSYLQPPTEYNDMLDQRFRSRFEIQFALWLTYNKVDYKYEGLTLRVHGKEYTPDFYFPGTDLFVELKGLWTGGARAKTIATKLAGVNLLLIPYYFNSFLLTSNEGFVCNF